MSATPSTPLRAPISLHAIVLLAAAAVALLSARPYTGGWNDSSRLASVECLVDHHTLAIDRSTFLDQTCDKLFVRGHYYSDKSPVPAVFMAGLYQGWRTLTGLRAADDPDKFCYFLTVGTSGLAYVVAVWCMFQLGGVLQLPLGVRSALTMSFALSTVALPYTRHVNNHELLLGVAAALFLGIANLARARAQERPSWLGLLGVGGLTGLAYTIDLGAGPVLVLCVFGYVLSCSRRVGPVAVFLLAAAPWFVLHHALNYAVGGTFKPANAVPEHLQWPGSPFSAQNMTGGWNHSGVGHFLTYAAALLMGKRGFLTHNLPLLLVIPGVVALLKRRTAQRPELLCACGWCCGTWLVYALTSNNYSGLCCSVRWFVPLLAPAYYVLAVFLGRHPSYRWDFLVLSGWGALLSALMWVRGPWQELPLLLLGPVVAAAVLSWFACRRWCQRREKMTALPAATIPEARAA